jgi:crossover junction endodeoxyribonuclease RuvC
MGLTIGVDPGLTGALALLRSDGELICVVDMPTTEIVRNRKKKREIDYLVLGAYLRSMKSEGADRVFVERVGAMAKKGTKQGATSMFSFGKATGAVLGALGAIGLEIAEVSPVLWKKSFGLIGLGKDAARELAINTWGDSSFRRKKDCGRADSALIALYGLRMGR